MAKKKEKYKNVWKAIRKILLRFILFFFSFTILSVVVLKWMPIRYTPLMFQRYMENISNNSYYNTREWKPIEKISYNMVLAVLASEDNNFMGHWGFDMDAIKRAMEQNRRRGTKYGASTISQQTAKNVYLLPSRTWIRKGFEAYFTVLIELVWSKERIMEVYLNIVEVGDGLYGVEAASQKYFNKPASKLTANEAAQIASILPNPRLYNLTSPSQYLINRQQKIRRLMRLVNPPDINAAKN